MRKLELQVAVGADASGAKVQLAATAFIPPAGVSIDPLRVVFAIPGGGYSRGYFDMHFPGRADYSQAEHHAAQGLLLIALDPLGVGTSSLPDATTITIEQLASTYDHAVRDLLARLRTGGLDPNLAPMPEVRPVGIGQSMGGCITIVTQARHQTFAAISPLGYSAIHTVLPQPSAEQRARAIGGFVGYESAKLDASTVAKTSETITDFRYPFHWDDEPEDIVAADMAGGYPLRRVAPPFGSATIPACAVRMMTPGLVAKEAAAVRVPVLIGVGERDVCPDPYAEPSAYRGSGDVTLLVVPRMAHMHNFAGTRRQLWDRLAAWYRTATSMQAGL